MKGVKIAIGLLLFAQAVMACTTLVYEYALTRWAPDPCKLR